MKDFKKFREQLNEYGLTPAMLKKSNPLRGKGYPHNESQRFGGKTNIPASPETKKYIESGKGIILDVPSSLHPTSRFAIYKNPAKGSRQDKVLMATISNPKRGRVKMFSFHGSHVSHQKAMDFAKKHKLVAMKDEKGNPLYAKESVELDERYDKPVKIVYRAKNVKAMRELSDIAADEMPNKVKQGFFSVEANPKSKTLAVTFNSEYDREQFEDEYKEELKRLTVRESVELDEGKTEFAVVAKASGMLIKAFPKEEHARMYIKNQYRQRKNLKGNLGIIEVPKSRAPGNNMKKHGEIEVVKEFVELDEVLSDREMARFTKAHTAQHMKMHKQALQIIKFIDSVAKHKEKWTDSFGDFVTAKINPELAISNPVSVEYQQGRGRGDWSFIIQNDMVRYNNRNMPWLPKGGELKFDKFMKLLDTWKKETLRESVELDEGKAWDAILRIKDQMNAEKVHGVLVDMQTAKLLCDVMYALNKGNQKKMMAVIDKNAAGLKKMVDFAWKQVK